MCITVAPRDYLWTGKRISASMQVYYDFGSANANFGTDLAFLVPEQSLMQLQGGNCMA